MSLRKKKASPFTLFSFQDIITSVMGIMLFSALLLAVELTRRTNGAPELAVSTAINTIEATLDSVQGELPRLQAELEAMTINAQNVAETLAPDLPQRKAVETERTQRLKAELTALELAVETRKKQRNRLQAQQFDRRGVVAQLENLEQEIAQSEMELTALAANKRLFFNAAPGSSKTPWVIDFAESRILVGPLPVPETASAPPAELPTPERLIAFCETLSPSSDYFLLMLRPSAAGSLDIVADKLRDKGFDYGFDLLDDDQEIFPGMKAP